MAASAKPGRHPQQGGERAAHQSLLEVEWGKACNTSIGLGRMSGGTMRVLDRRPRVTNHHPTSTSPTNKAVSPSARA